MVPETSLRAGRNRIELFEVRAGRHAACRFSAGRLEFGSALGSTSIVRRVLVHVDQRAEVAPAVVARHAGAEQVVAELDRVRRLEVADQLLVAAGEDEAAERVRVSLGLLGLGHDDGPCGEAGDHHSDHGRQQQAGADPVGEHLELRARRGARLGSGPPLPGPPRKPRGHRRDQHKIAEGRDEHAGNQVHAAAHRRQLPHDQTVEQRDGDEGGPHPRPAQPPADAGGPEALVSIHCTAE